MSGNYTPGQRQRARDMGIAPHELAGWPDKFPADEHCLAQRGARSLYPEWAIRLAGAMIEHALHDLRAAPWTPDRAYVAADYRPDPDGARAWLHDQASDHALSVVWCEQVLRTSLDPLRRRYPAQNSPVNERKRPASRRGLRMRPRLELA